MEIGKVSSCATIGPDYGIRKMVINNNKGYDKFLCKSRTSPASIHRTINGLTYLYIMLHNQCSYKKARNVGLTMFYAFLICPQTLIWELYFVCICITRIFNE